MAPTRLSSNWMTSLLLTVTSLGMMTTSCDGFRVSRHEPNVAAEQPAQAAARLHAHSNTRHKRGAASVQDLYRTSEPSAAEELLRYGVLLDAGSSSTKVKVYSYTPAVPPSLVPHVRLEVSERVPHGLGSLVSSSRAEVRDYLVGALAHATAAVVPASQHAHTPVFVMATAGLRVLTALEAKRLLGEVRAVLGDPALNPFVFHPEHVSILSGEEEAVYAWLAVNYLRGFFSSSSRSKLSRRQSVDPVGVMEIGGGSMQVAFLPDTPLFQEEFQVYVGRRRFDLYAQSYLSYGSKYLTDQVRRRLLLQQERGDAVGKRDQQLFSPCMLSEDTDSFEWDDVTYRVTGTGNASLCEEVLASILQPPDSAALNLCSPGPCAIGDTYQPKVGEHPFYAISAFQYAPRHLDAVEGGGVLNITKLRHHARKYCGLTVLQAVAQTGTKAKFASNDCLMGLYIPTLLTTALGFDPHTRTITVANEINGTRIDWALGAMVQHLSMTFMDDLDALITCRHRQEKSFNRSVQRVTNPSLGSHLVTSTLTLTLTTLVTLVWGGCTRLLW